MKPFWISSNRFLSKPVQGFYHVDYLGYRKPGNPDYINILKNTYNSFSKKSLNQAAMKVLNILIIDLPKILKFLNTMPLIVCVVPRAKTQYSQNQLLFKYSVHCASRQIEGFIESTDSILRHTNTRTTHLPASTPNYNNDGSIPYPGITKSTCNISKNITNKNVLLIDDIYTNTINIDEDAIQSLLDGGARSVSFYAIAKTI